jgi:hypothetical protein
VELAENAVGMLNMNVAFERDGTFTRLVEGPTGEGWNAAFGASVPPQYVIDEADLEPDGIAKQPIDLALMPNEDGAATATVTIVVHEQDSDKKSTKTFNLVLRASDNA